MKTRSWMGLAVATAMVLGLATVGFAQFGGQQGGQQGGPQGGPPPGGPPAVMHSGAQGVYVLTGNTLTRYDAATLAVKGTLTLGAQTTTPRAGRRAEGGQRPQPPAPGTFLVSSDASADMLLVVLGDTYYAVAGDPLKIMAQIALPAGTPPGNQQGEPGRPQLQGQGRGPGGQQGGPGGQQGGPGGQQGMGPGGPPPLPMLELRDGTLYVLRGHQLAAIDTVKQVLLAQAVMAAPAGD